MKRGLAIGKTLVSILFDIEIVLWFMRRLPPLFVTIFYVIAKLFEEKRTT
jgi:hypothetical protein